MTDFDRAIHDLEKIIKAVPDGYGAVPMPIRTVKEALGALTLEKILMDYVHGFDVTEERSVQHAEKHIKELLAYDLDDETIHVVETALGVLKTVLSRYHSTCSKRYFHGHK